MDSVCLINFAVNRNSFKTAATKALYDIKDLHVIYVITGYIEWDKENSFLIKSNAD